MPAYTLRIRRSDPAAGDAAYWDEHPVEHAATSAGGDDERVSAEAAEAALLLGDH